MELQLSIWNLDFDKFWIVQIILIGMSISLLFMTCKPLMASSTPNSLIHPPIIFWMLNENTLRSTRRSFKALTSNLWLRYFIKWKAQLRFKSFIGKSQSSIWWIFLRSENVNCSKIYFESELDLKRLMYRELCWNLLTWRMRICRLCQKDYAFDWLSWLCNEKQLDLLKLRN